MAINGGTGSNNLSGYDGTLYVTAENNNDWLCWLDAYNSGKSEYGLQIDIGSGATYAMRIRGNNSEVYRIEGNGVAYGVAARYSSNLAVGTNSLQNANVASFRGGLYNQINIAHGSNTGWGLLLTNTDQNGYGSNSGYHFSTNTSVNSPCAVVNVQNDSLHFGTNNTSRWFITYGGNLLPYSNDSYDIGGTGNRVRNLYTTDLQLSNESKKDKGGNDVDGTWGDYTIQEGESDLFLINNRSGKKYKFMLQEVA